MTKLLDDAVAAIRARPDAEQDEAAEMLLWWLEREQVILRDDETRDILSDSLRDAEAGLFVADPEEAVTGRAERFKAAIDVGIADLADNRSRVVEDRDLDAYMAELGDRAAQRPRRSS